MPDARPICPVCYGPVPVALEPWSPSHYVYVCPCCSSRFHGWFDPATYEEGIMHSGSHNDYGTYLCEAADA